MYVNNYNSVADIYDIYNQSDYDVSFYIKRYRSFQGSAVELMAGTGRLAIPLLKSGIRLDCVDISSELLEQLTGKLEGLNLQAEVFNADIRNFQPEKPYDLVIIGFNSFSEIIDESDQASVFQSIYRNLSPSGEFVFSLYNPIYRRKFITNALSLVNEYESGDRKILFYIASQENEQSIVDLTQLYEFYNKEGSLEEKRMLKLKFKLIPKGDIENLIHDTGFMIKRIYGNYDETSFDEDNSPFMIYIVGK